MYLKRSPEPREFVSNSPWFGLELSQQDGLSDLERAIVSFVISSDSEKGGREYQHTASYRVLQEFIFEYISSNNGNRIISFIDQNIRRLDALDTGLGRGYQRMVTKLRNHFRRLKTKPVTAIGYLDFEPKDLGKIDSAGTTPFRRYCNAIINNLVDREILIRYRELGPTYVGLNSKIQFEYYPPPK